MKRLGYFAASIGTLALVLWTCCLSIELIQKIHYLPLYLKSNEGNSALKITTLTASNTANNAFVADEETYNVPPPADHPPMKIVCGSHVFRVVYVAHEWLQRKKEPAFAETELDNRLMILDRQRTGSDIREDVMHELIHISLWEAGGKRSGMPNEEESYVKAAAPVLRDIFADNPNLVRWLVRAGG